jgi:DNA-directed RNA polymerase specialized sigma24 family protein
MHLVEGYTLAELEEFFNVSAETLKTRLRRSKARLKKFLLI